MFFNRLNGKCRFTIIICFSVSFCVASSTLAVDNYLMFNAKINGQPVILAFDTGAGDFMLFRKSAERLNLTVIDPPKDIEDQPGRVKAGYTETCRFSIPNIGIETDVRFRVFELPPVSSAFHFDGVMGWPNIKENLLQIDADNETVEGLDKLPDDIGTWSKWVIYDNPDSRVLLIKVPDATGQEGVILIDTGNPGGVSLNSQRWKDWLNNNKSNPYTLSAYYTPAVGLKVNEERWADNLSIGHFTISDIPIKQFSPVFKQAIPGLQARFGLFALSRLEVIIDGLGGYFYTRPRKNPQSKYQYNRTAAVFIPKNPMIQQLVAHVVENGPAYQAGIRNGDILLKIDELDVTKWQTDPKVLPLSRFWRRPAGTKLKLSLKRDDNSFKTVVELKDIFTLTATD